MAPGGTLTYTLVVTNLDPGTKTGVKLENTLSGGVAFVSASSTPGTCSHSAGLVTCNIGTLASGASATVTIGVTATGSHLVLVNTAAIFIGNDVAPSCVATPLSTVVGDPTNVDIPTLSTPLLALLALALAGAGVFLLGRLS